MFDEAFVVKKRWDRDPVAQVDPAEPKTPIVKMKRNASAPHATTNAPVVAERNSKNAVSVNQ